MLGKMKKMPSPSPTPTSLQNEGGGTLQVLATLRKHHEANNSSEVLKDSQVIFHMCI